MDDPGVRLLGDVVVTDAEAPTAGRPSRSTLLRTLLALLAVAPGRVVASEVLIDELWDEDLPQDPRAALSVQMTRLRAWLLPDDPRAAPVRSGRGGYRLTIDPMQVDLPRFDAEAERAFGTRDLERVEGALAEWRDLPFGGCVISDRLRSEQVRLVERHRCLVELRADLLLDADQSRRALEGLLPVRAADLGRERLTALAMRAYRAQTRRREALAAFDECRRHLREEYGLSPGPELRRLHAELLSEDVPAPIARTAPTLVGRTDELDVLRRARPAGGVVVIEGPAGMGKSALLRAAGPDGTGTWDADDAPFGAWREALAALRALPREPLDGAVLHRVLVGLAAAGRGVLVGLEDAHRADAASLGLLRSLVRRGVPAGVLVVVTARTADLPHAAWETVRADLALADRVHLLPLAELDAEAVTALTVRRLDHLDPAAAQRLADAVARRAGGHPLHVTALLDAVQRYEDEAHCAEAVEGVPETLRPLLQRQVALLPDRARRPLEALGVLRPTTPEVLAAVLATTAAALLDDLRPALELGLLADDGDVAFRHEVMADVVADTVPLASRRRWHRAALAEVEDPFQRRRHGLGAGPLVGRRELAELHLRAGQVAYRRGAVAEALGYLDEAWPDRPDAEVALLRGLALTALGRLDEAHDLLDHLVADLDPTEEQARRAAVGDGSLGWHVTGDARRLARLRAVADRPGARGIPDRERMEFLLTLTIEETVLEGRTSDPATLAEVAALAVRLAEDPDHDTSTRARLVLLRGLAEAPVPAAQRLEAARSAARRSVRATDPAVRLDAGEALVASLLAHGCVEEARDRSWWLRREARRVHRPRSMWVGSLVDAALALAAGEVDEADALAARAHGLGIDLGLPDAPGTLQAFTMVRHWQTGTAALLGEVPAMAARAYPHLPAWTAAAACADAQAGRLDAAAEHLRQFRARRAVLEARTFDRPALCLAAAAAFRLRDVETARLVQASLPADPDAVVILGMGAAILGPATLFRGLADAVLDDRDAALDHLEQAAVLAGDIGWVPWKDTAVAVARRVETDSGPALPLGLG